MSLICMCSLEKLNGKPKKGQLFIIVNIARLIVAQVKMITSCKP